MDPDRIAVSKVLLDGFFHIASFFQNPTELTEEVKRQATKINCIQIQDVRNTILMQSNNNISTLNRYPSLNVRNAIFRDSSTSKIVNNNTWTYFHVTWRDKQWKTRYLPPNFQNFSEHNNSLGSILTDSYVLVNITRCVMNLIILGFLLI